jgi:hypothetical protein
MTHDTQKRALHSMVLACAAALTAVVVHAVAHNVLSVGEPDIFNAATLSASLLGGLLVGTLMRAFGGLGCDRLLVFSMSPALPPRRVWFSIATMNGARRIVRPETNATSLVDPPTDVRR